MRARVAAVFLLVAILVGPSCILNITAPVLSGSTSTAGIEGGAASLASTFGYRLATSSDIASLRAEIGTSSGNATYVTEYGHGTGLVPPTAAGWDSLVGRLRIADASSVAISMPSSAASVDLSTEQFFPPVGDQGNRGTCAAWAVTYYAYGYMAARSNNWTDASTGNLTHLMSPDWTYSKVAVNGLMSSQSSPWDGGSYTWDNANVIKVLGCAPMSTMPYNTSSNVKLAYGDSTAWRASLANHIQENYTFTVMNDSTIQALKALLADNTPVVISMEGRGMDNNAYFTDGNYVISSVDYTGMEENHAVCIVGYDDTIIDDGEQGTFKVVNSWGTNFGVGGYFWLTYDALKKIGNASSPTYMVVDDSYRTRFAAIIQTDPAPDRYANITIGIGPITAPIAIVRYQFNGSTTMRLPTYMAIDVTALYPAFISGENDFFVNLTSATLAGNIASFRIEEYQGPSTSIPTGLSSQASGLPTTLTAPGSAIAYLTYSSYTAPSYGQALDVTGLDLSSGGLVPWTSVPYGSRSGPYCVQSGTVGDKDSSWLKLKLNQTGLLSFYWKVSSNGNGDELTFRMDGQLIQRINGTNGWAKVIQIVQAGDHVMTWTYQKDASGISGEDAGLIDDMVWVPARMIGVQDFEGGASSAWTVGDLNSSNGLDYWGVEPYLDEYQQHVAWCANVGTNSGNYPGYENSYTRYYDMGMEAYLDFVLPAGQRYQYLAVDFLYHGSVLTINGKMVDYLYFESHNASGWSREWVMPSYSPNPNVIEIFGWTYVFVPIANDTDEVRLMFHSGDTLWDSFGMYIDEVRVMSYSEFPEDLVAPVTQMTVPVGVTNETGITFSCTVSDDGGSGLDRVDVYCKVPGQTSYSLLSSVPVSGPGTITGSLTLPNGPDGTYQLYSVGVDKAGNSEAPPAGNDAAMVLDRTAPVTSASLNGVIASGGWYHGTVTFGLVSSDVVSGVDQTQYRYPGGTWSSYVSTFTIPSSGTYTVEFRSQDDAGNWETGRSVTFSIEDQVPYTTIAISGNKTTDGWYSGNATFVLNSIDNDSGVDQTEYQLDDGAWTRYTGPVKVASNGPHIVLYRATDNAGNVELAAQMSFKVDSSAPVSDCNIEGEYAGLGRYNGTVNVTLMHVDIESGVNVTFYRIDGGNWSVYSASFQISSMGAHTVQYYSRDIAGNTEPIRTTNLTVVINGTSGVPGLVTGLDVTSANGEIRLVWNAPSGEPVTLYRIYRGESAGAMVLLATLNGTGYIDSNITSGRTYHYSVTATNAAGNGASSLVVTGTSSDAGSGSNLFIIVIILVVIVASVVLAVVLIRRRKR